MQLYSLRKGHLGDKKQNYIFAYSNQAIPHLTMYLTNILIHKVGKCIKAYSLQSLLALVKKIVRNHHAPWQEDFINKPFCAHATEDYLCVLSHFSHVWLCDSTDCSLPGFSDHGLFQVRILEWVVMPSSRGSSQPRDWTHIFYVYLHWQAGSLPLAAPGKPTAYYAAIKKNEEALCFLMWAHFQNVFSEKSNCTPVCLVCTVV